MKFDLKLNSCSILLYANKRIFAYFWFYQSRLTALRNKISAPRNRNTNQFVSLTVCQSASCPSCPPPHCKLSKYEACLVVRLMIRYYDSDVEGLEVSADMTNVILMFHPLDPLRPLSWNTLDDFYNWILRFCSGNKRSVPVSGKRYLHWLKLLFSG